jgi:tetratricopeptide (TPR) repeat protein
MAQITLRDYLQETEDVIGNGRADDALNRCQYVLARFPESLEAQRLLGEVYLAQEHYDEAQQTFDWVLTNDPENVIVYCDRALISERRADYDTALDCYQQAYELSRGNNQIRNEFNKLSAKVGQQGFMFSRAGLARLYMRGDLLTQAIQEWEAVLAVTPDRLDARTGLLEAYWRDGLYDRVEQLATQILQDVPGCEKALLLLAYVVSAKDMEQARGLLQRVEALDPDLVMAQDLFSDLMASQPNEPFLALLKKNPVALEKALEQESISPVNGALSQQEELFATSGNSTLSSSLPGWADLESWNGETTLPRVSPESQVSPLSADLPVWSGDSFAALSDAQTMLNQGQSTTSGTNGAQEQSDLASYLNAMGSSGSSWELPQQPSSGEQQDEPWMQLQASLDKMKQEFEASAATREQPSSLDLSQWGIAENPPEQPSLSGFEWSGSEQTLDATSFASSWSTAPKETSAAPAPDWLNQLTQQGERRQVSGNLPPVPSSDEPQAPSIQPLLEPQAAAQPPVAQEAVIPPASPPPAIDKVVEEKQEPEKKEEPAFSPFASGGDDDEEESFFGPQWLKALGAASIDDDEETEAAVEEPPARPEPSTVQEAPQTYEPWTAPAPEVVQEQKPAVTWSQPVEQESKQPNLDTAWGALAETTPPLTPAASSSEYSWSQSLEQQLAPNDYSWNQPVEQQQAASSPEYSWSQSLEQLAPSNEYNWSQQLETQQEPQGVGEVLPLSPEEANGWEKPDELYWDGQSGSADNDYTFESVPPIRTTETANAEPFDKTEQQMLLTLEELEKNLLSDGFVPLEPNWLANLAQEQKAPSLPPSEEPQETYAEPPLSSALAELGQIIQQPQQPQEASMPTLPTVEPPIEEEPQVFEQPEPAPEMPLWAASLRPTPLPPQQEKSQPAASVRSTPPSPQPEKPAAVLRPTPVPVPPRLWQQRSLSEDDFDDGDAPTTHVAAVKPPVKPVVRAIPPKKPSEPVKPTPVTPSAARKDTFADIELETTMRRPAIRLEPMQQPRPAASHEQGAGRSRGRSGERTPGGKASEVSYQERLLKGYQYQLLGDYDDAMQEYRAVIRNAPDLLGEVISNVRALLKLAPGYSTGYRVLGDAYMRQGEYLQAMEAYNKALTMAKKAKA